KESSIMAERRPLAAAVNHLSGADPEQVRAFITQERKPEEASSRTEEVELNSRPREESPREEKSRGEVSASRRTSTSSSSSSRAPRRKPTRLQPVGLIPVTIRLRPEIAGALKRASLERQLGGEDIFTQQDLVEQALEPWLIDEGYISSSN
ncbi:MAG: hypothetical protein WD049_01170, partial [Candidatus Paceibacterota bacterium]